MPTRVLIVGAGISGSIAAFWLARHPLFRITIIERSKSSQKMGQGLEIEEPATSIVRAMGILDKFQAIRTSEKGFELNDETGRVFGRFEAGPFSPTGALEMMRGDMTEVLYRAADESPNVDYRYETTIQALHQDDKSVTVDLLTRTTQTTTSETFDIVIGADGALSKTRHLAMGSSEQLDCFRPIGAYCAYFSLPSQPQDGPYSRACNFPGRRILWTRPTREDSNITSGYAIHVTDNNPSLHAAFLSKDRNVQKQALVEDFKHCGWEGPRICKEIMAAENFYFDELAQVKLPKWSVGRVVLTGDASWAPTPFTGAGNHLAIIGAFVLAQELTRHADSSSPAAAFEAYEARSRPYVTESQKLPLNGHAVKLVNPETVWGIFILRRVIKGAEWLVKLLKWSGLTKWFAEDDGGHAARASFDLQLEGEGFSKEGKKVV